MPLHLGRRAVYNDVTYRCAYCDVDYGFLLKYESLEKDLSLLKDELDLKYDVTVKDEERTEVSFNKTARYIRLLDRDTLKRLTEAFSVDFEMFDYDPKRYSSGERPKEWRRSKESVKKLLLQRKNRTRHSHTKDE